jgi:hypothetical protein
MTVALAALLLAAAIASASNTALAQKGSAEDHMKQLPACEKHQTNKQDCHIHDKDTYLHMKLQKPMNGPHARSEFNRHRHDEQRMMRN